ncbi:MAG TPA: helix-turn-helix transcriptional regulator, partial [Alicyclobacillus sp.]|nr:helix-turn-helix transcriptional regulator [Alicyclobacillus sp.]
MRTRLRQERRSRRWTQCDMAAYLGMTERAYRHLESGTRNPSKETIDKLEDLFGVPQRELLALNSTPRKKVTTMSDIDIAALKEQLRREIMEEIMNYRRVSDDTPWAQVKKYMTERFELAGLQRT